MLLPINAARLGSLLAKRYQSPIDRGTQTLP